MSGNNAAVKLLEGKVEMLRAALANVARMLTEDFRSDRLGRTSSSNV